MTLSTKPEVINIATSSEKDRATVTDNTQYKFGEIWPRGFWDMRVDRQINRQTHHNILHIQMAK